MVLPTVTPWRIKSNTSCKFLLIRPRERVIDSLRWLAEAIHQEGMIVDLKNSPELIQTEPKMAEAFDFSVIESCVC